MTPPHDHLSRLQPTATRLSRWIHRLRVIVIGCCLLLFTGARAEAEFATYTFTGTVTIVSSSLDGMFNTSMTLSGSFTYDTSAAGVLTGTEAVGVRGYFNNVSNLVMTIGSYTASAPPFGEDIFHGMYVLNNWFPVPTDGFQVTGRLLNSTQINGQNPHGILFFYTSDTTATSNTQLADLGDLTGWPDRYPGTNICSGETAARSGCWHMSWGGQFFVVGEITSLVRQASTVVISLDIRPGSDDNPVSASQQGLLPVAILGRHDLDVTTIDPSTLQLAGVDLALRGSVKRPQLAHSLEDVNGDGFTDLVAFFGVPDLVSAGALTTSTIALTITGALTDGTAIQGADSVKVVP
jgi:hypothetical protein